MQILVADDDPLYRQLLESVLTGWGYVVVCVNDGFAALRELENGRAPRIAIIDWMMPGNTGLEVCQRVREMTEAEAPYLILLTAKSDKKEVAKGLDSGADDYITKPFDCDELRARLHVARRIIGLQRRLAEQVSRLGEAFNSLKRLQGLLPICCYCKRIRNEKEYWEQVEEYISERSDASFTHGICPDCFESRVWAEPTSSP